MRHKVAKVARQPGSPGLSSSVLDALGETLDEARMQQLNHEIDGRQRQLEEVAREVVAGWGWGPGVSP